MIGPTGVGKTEIARRLAKLAHSPFIKVEASKFTEVGYVGRDVESMVRDLVELAVDMVREERIEEVAGESGAERRGAAARPAAAAAADGAGRGPRPRAATRWAARAQRMREQLRAGKLDDRMVEVDVQERSFPSIELITGLVDGGNRRQPPRHDAGLLPGAVEAPPRTVAEARERLRVGRRAEADRHGAGRRAAVERVEQAGIIFVDEIDKIAGREGGHGPDVSREGVQRDILPIVEGTTVNTKHGMVRTDHILFIAAGAFHVSKPSDLIPELQGRFPIRVELEPLGQAEFVRILTEPRSALIKQYTALMATEGVDLGSRTTAMATIAEFATHRQRAHREHRRPAAAHRHGAAARRGVVRGADAAGEVDYDRRGLRPPHARGHREERRPVPLHIVTLRLVRARWPCATRTDRSLRAGPSSLLRRRLARDVIAACGKKGPPLAPFVARAGRGYRRDAAARLATTSTCRSRCRRPTRTARSPPTSARLRSTRSRPRRLPRRRISAKSRTLIATLPVRPVLPAPPAPADGSPPPPIPLPPGVDRGATVAVKETLTPDARVAVELPVDRLHRKAR